METAGLCNPASERMSAASSASAQRMTKAKNRGELTSFAQNRFHAFLIQLE